jgi:hypothetical protein
MASLFKRKNVPEGVDPARIPPGQTLTAPDRWPLLHFGPVPKTDIAKWDFNVFGAVENPLRLDYGELRALPSKEVVADIHCVTGWSRLGDRWTGVPIREILARVSQARGEVRNGALRLRLHDLGSAQRSGRRRKPALLRLERGGPHPGPRLAPSPVRALQVLLEVCKVVARARVHGTQPARFLGATWLSRRSRPLERDKVLVTAS